MEKQYWLVPRDKPGLLIAMMQALMGEAHISFEGDLSRCRGLFLIPGASLEETPSLRRQTLAPRQDFVVLPLVLETARLILNEVLPDGRAVRDVIHIQIEKGGRLQFGAYDHFHPECIGCSDGVPIELLQRLHSKGVLKSWETSSKEEHRSQE